MDEQSLHQRLHHASTAGSRELDRTCEAAAHELVDAGEEPPFEVDSADFAADPYLITADRYWRLRFLALPTVDTAARCAEWLERHVAEQHRAEVRQKWALGYAFITRDNVESPTELTESSTWIVERYRGSPAIMFFAILYHAGKFRANHDFEDLRSFLGSSVLALACSSFHQHPTFVALQAFASLGSRHIARDSALEPLRAAWAATDRSWHTVDICLHALAVAPPFDGQAQLLRDYALEAAEEFPQQHLVHFRLATGQRLAGEHAAALNSVDTALRLLPAVGNRTRHELFQEQFLRERALITNAQHIAEITERYEHRLAEQEAGNEEVRRSLAAHTVRVVEVVTLVMAAITFAVGSLQVTLSGDLPTGDRALLIGMLGGGLALFALLVVGGTWWITRHRRER